MVVRAFLSCGNGSYTMLNARGLRIHEKMRCRNFPSSSPKTRMSQMYTGVDTSDSPTEGVGNWVKVRHDFHLASSFPDNGIFFRRKDARQISIACFASSAPGAVQARWFIACSILEPKIRSLRLIPSNFQPNYQLAFAAKEGRSRELLPLHGVREK